MVAPVHQVYNVAAGQPIYGGRYPVAGPLTGAAQIGPLEVSGGFYGPGNPGVFSNVWTPAKDVDGNITDASWAQLPLNEMCVVNQTSIQSIDAQLLAGGYNVATDNYGNGDTVGSFYAWVGCARNGRLVYFPRGGGHADSSMNAIIGLNLEKLGSPSMWFIEAMPSDPDNPTYPWAAAYKASGAFTVYKITANEPTVWPASYVLPDGLPCSSHTYDGVWFDPVRNTINTSRIDRWAWDLTNKNWTRTFWTKNGPDIILNISSVMHYHAGTDRLFGHFSLSDTDYFSLNWTQGNSVALQNVVGAAPNDWNAKGGLSQTNLDADTLLYLWVNGYTGYESWAIYNLNTLTIASQGIVGNSENYDYLAEMMVNVYIPSWNKSIRRGKYSQDPKWWLFDLATKSNQAYTPAGLPPPAQNYMGNKAFYYAERNCFVSVTVTNNTSNSIYVMRTA